MTTDLIRLWNSNNCDETGRHTPVKGPVGINATCRIVPCQLLATFNALIAKMVKASGFQSDIAGSIPAESTKSMQG